MGKTKKGDEKLRIILTGGHAGTTAIAFVQEILKRKKNLEIFWVGEKSAFLTKKAPSLESEYLPTLGVKFHHIYFPKIPTFFSIAAILNYLKVPIGIFEGLILVLKIKPHVIVSFGGSSSLPIIFFSFLLRIPIIIHEQTFAAGRANLFASTFATKIAVARYESVKFFPLEKVKVTGNPIMENILKVKPKMKKNKPFTIFVTTGSRGSRLINNLIERILFLLLKEYKVIHQVGPLDYKKFLDLKSQLPFHLSNRYEIKDRINPFEMGKYYEKSDMIICRGGANTISEVAWIKRPAIIIPLRFSYLDEQTKNAKFLEKIGLGFVLKESEATPRKLFLLIKAVEKDWEKIVRKTKDFSSFDKEAAVRLVNLVFEQIYGKEEEK